MPRTADAWRAILAHHHQEHLADHLGTLDEPDFSRFERALDALDLKLIDDLVAGLRTAPPALDPATLRPPVARTLDPSAPDFADLRALGEGALRAGKVACVLVAGGQGSRLNHPGPKGTFAATPVRRKPLFQVFAEKALAIAQRTGASLPLCIMTSEENDAATQEWFRDRGFCGLPRDQVHFFRQGMFPAVDADGKLVLKARGELFMSPNGHGGTLLALRTSGVLDTLRAAGVEDLFYFQVDNPLVALCEPAFVGLHRRTRSEFSSKAVAKSGPDEKVGVLAEQGGQLTLIEYSDLPAALRETRTADGTLAFNAGSIAVHLIRLDFVTRLTEGRFQLPFHMARKSLSVSGDGGASREIPGIKFETFIFDALARARGTPVVMVRRQDEFAPIKNATGADSPATSAALQTAFAARTLEAAGATVPRGPEGAPRHPIEISPRMESDPAGLAAYVRRGISFDGPLYVGED